MSVHRVVLTAADEQYEPPEGSVVEVVVIAGRVFFTAAKQDYKDGVTTLTREYELPVLDLAELIRAIHAFTGGFSSSPLRESEVEPTGHSPRD